MLVPWRVHPQGVDVVVFHDPFIFEAALEAPGLPSVPWKRR